jgi:hypothetical protein
MIDDGVIQFVSRPDSRVRLLLHRDNVPRNLATDPLFVLAQREYRSDGGSLAMNALSECRESEEDVLDRLASKFDLLRLTVNGHHDVTEVRPEDDLSVAIELRRTGTGTNWADRDVQVRSVMPARTSRLGWSLDSILFTHAGFQHQRGRRSIITGRLKLPQPGLFFLAASSVVSRSNVVVVLPQPRAPRVFPSNVAQVLLAHGLRFVKQVDSERVLVDFNQHSGSSS